MANACTETRIKDDSHVSNRFDEINSLWQSQQLCDLTLKVAQTEFRVHKVILASCSKYFKNMFTQELFVENDKKCIELRQVDPDAFRVILEYFYSGYVVISETTAERLLATADFFTLTAVKSICGEYLCQHIDIENCIARYCMGVKFGLNELECQTKSFIVEKLDEVSKTQHFQKINQETLKELLGTTETNANGDQIYTAVMKWVKYDLDTRKLFLSDLVELIPTENISHDFYMNSMINDEVLRQDFKCLHWLLDRVVNKFAKLYVNTSYFEVKLFITSRSIDKSECFQLQLTSNELKPLPARPDIACFSAISYKKSIYLTAGKYHCRDLEKSYKYETNGNSWSEINLNFERYEAGACILRDQLFVVGGRNIERDCFLSSCISYDFNSDQKLKLPKMKKKKSLSGISVHHNSVYVCCGRNESWLASIERYDPREGFWQNVGEYKFVSGWCSSAVICDSLYTSYAFAPIVERFDLRNNSSEKLAEPIATYCNSITSSQTKLLRVHTTGLSEYDVNKNLWLSKEYNFNFEWPTVVPWDST